ncbi:MAG TPA: Gfo/Idh/MocA family oxidoreductase [Longimicrobiaceae bacterium]
MTQGLSDAGAIAGEMEPTLRVKWGILGTAAIARTKVIPALQRGTWTEVVAIASRDEARAQQVARELGIARAYGSYEALLADPEVQVVYNPLPNHLHVPWTARAAEAGKHVLCEKPIAMDAAEARELLAIRERTGVMIGEAFMVRLHPQWIEARRLVQEGQIGEVRLISAYFSYFKLDPDNIRNRLEYGGGALMDIGCYPVNLSRFIYGEEPTRAVSMIERDPQMGIDRLTSVMLEFPSGHATFTCSTQLGPAQRMQIFGTRGRIDIEIPFNAPPDRPVRIVLDDGSSAPAAGGEIIEFPPVDQYTLQGDAFSSAVIAGTHPPVPLEDAIRNMEVIDAIFRSAESGGWEEIGT